MRWARGPPGQALSPVHCGFSELLSSKWTGGISCWQALTPSPRSSGRREGGGTAEEDREGAGRLASLGAHRAPSSKAMADEATVRAGNISGSPHPGPVHVPASHVSAERTGGFWWGGVLLGSDPLPFHQRPPAPVMSPHMSLPGDAPTPSLLNVSLTSRSPPPSCCGPLDSGPVQVKPSFILLVAPGRTSRWRL